jgi:hypothetical protein
MGYGPDMGGYAEDIERIRRDGMGTFIISRIVLTLGEGFPEG